MTFFKMTSHKQVSKPKEDWIKVEHTHEPLVSQEAWDAALPGFCCWYLVRRGRS